jgi:hypothetical protein
VHELPRERAARQSANEYVALILAGTLSPVVPHNDYITVGGPDAATGYVAKCAPVWHSTPGAVEWLSKITASLPANDA